MASAHELLSKIEAALLGSSPLSPSQRIDLLHSIRAALPSLQSLLSFPEPKESDRAHVKSKEVRFPNKPPLSLDDTDVEIALKLSDDLHLNEINCVQLLVLANTEWALTGRDKIERYRLAAGLWYMERRDLISSLYILLRSVVLDHGLDPDLVFEIQKYLEKDLFNSSLRSRLIFLIRGLNREDASGFGHQNSEKYLMDIRGTLIERKSIVNRERLSLSHCLALSVLVSQISPKDIKDVFLTLKDCAAQINENSGVIELQITFALMFCIIISLISDALRDTNSPLSSDPSFKNDFHQMVTSVGANNNKNIKGFIGIIKLAWVVHLLLSQNQNPSRETISRISQILDLVCSENVFQFLLASVIQTSAYKNDDEDMLYIYGGYLHKMMMGFLSNPISRDKVKEMKEKAMSTQNAHMLEDINEDASLTNHQPFISLLELISQIYQNEPEMLHNNEELWLFLNLAGEEHKTIQTLVSFLNLLCTLASDEEGATRVYELLQGNTFRSIGWTTLFDCLTIYEERFKKSIQNSILPDFPKPEADALVAYLNILKKVVENGNEIERKKWFVDIEPLFKLLSYENVPPYLKGALRNSIAAFIKVSPFLKDTIWNYLQQYELPVINQNQNINFQNIPTKVYDMRYELNEVEARSERYPSTISYLNLLNALIREETDLSDRGQRFMGIYKFVHDHVFAPFPQRAYADSSEKWQLVLACLEHFLLILNFGVITDENITNSLSETQIPAVELMKDLMSGREVFRNVTSVLLLGVNSLIEERSTKSYGHVLERVVRACLELFIAAMGQDSVLAESWRPLYQTLDIILAQDLKQIVSLLEYIRYDLQPDIQKCSIKLMRILSSRMVGLVQILFKSGSAKSLIEDYATCLEFRFDDAQIFENPKDDIGVLILQLLIENIPRPMPNISHLLLSFDMDRVERTKLQPKFHYSCLKVILDNLEKLSKPDINTLLHELSFQLLYELCIDPATTGPVTDVLSTRRYQFFSKHIDTIGVAPLPKGDQALRISTLHQRAWLLKLLALELHVADVSIPSHHETCLAIISDTFTERNKMLELLQLVRFRCSDSDLKYPDFLSSIKYQQKVQQILTFNETIEFGGVYYYSERGDRLIEIDALETRLLQMMEEMSININEFDKNQFKDLTHKLVRWALVYNKVLEEQTAQLHLLNAWSQIVEIAISRRMPLLGDYSQILYELLDASLSVTASSDCSKKMAVILTNVALTCMAKLRDSRFLSPGGADSDTVTCLDIILIKHLPAGAYHSILFKLIMSLLRNESSEALRTRQYALLLSYFKYCQSMLDPEVPASIVRYLLSDEQDDDDDFHLQKIDKEQNELARANFSIMKKEAQPLIDLIIKDATMGSESIKPISFYILDVFISIDSDKYFLNQIQSRGLLRLILSDISKFSSKSGPFSFELMQRLCTIEAQICLLTRICHKYGKHGAQILQSMGALDHLSTCSLQDLFNLGDSKWNKERGGFIEKQRFLIIPILRLVSCITSLASSSDYTEAKNKILREVLDFVRSHNLIFAQKLKEDIQTKDESFLEQVYLAVFIICKVWPYDENDEYRFTEEILKKMRIIFNRDVSLNYLTQSDLPQNEKKSEIVTYRLCFSLISYLYNHVNNKEIQLQVHESGGSKPALETLLTLLSSVCILMEKNSDEKFILLNKVQNINELSRQEVDEMIKLLSIQENYTSPYDNIRKRRYVAMIQMCQLAGDRDELLSLLLQIAESVIHILLLNLQNPEDFDPRDLGLFCGSLHSVLERLEHLNEEKVGQNLKLFRRSISTLKEISIRNMDSN